jgi:hypothetical protein
MTSGPGTETAIEDGQNLNSPTQARQRSGWPPL